MIKATLVALTALMASSAAVAQEAPKARHALTEDGEPRAVRPLHTYSITARDPKTGELGVAVQTHWFSVGTSVAWARPGIGAVATQSFTLRSYGPLGLELMASGKTAEQALKALIAADPGEAVRQVGMVDAKGRTAVHTGKDAIIEHCHHAGEGFTVQANLMLKPTVCDAMIKAYTETKGDLAERMMMALEAAQAEGGDIRGQQSAALLVVSGDRSKDMWNGTQFNLRVDDNAAPVEELRRLLTVARGYKKMQEGDDLWTEGKVQEAKAAYLAAETMMPNNHEAVFWHAVTLAAGGYVEDSLPLFAKAYAKWPDWRTLVPRLPKSGLLPDDKAVIEKIINAK